MLTIKIPSSKSISNRALVLAVFNGEGKTIRNILKAEDTEVMFEAYKVLGVEFEVLHENKESIDIKIIKNACKNSGKFFMNNSGTSTRFLIPCLALINGEFILDGIERMRQRPISDLVDALLDLGIKVEYLGNNGFLPIKLCSTGNLNGVARIKCDLSSQYLSGLLLAKKLSGDSFEIEILGDTLVSKPYIDLTDQVIDIFFSSNEYLVETDFSSASYFIAIGLLGDSEIFIENINQKSLQADRLFVETLLNLGGELKYKNNGLLCKPSKFSVDNKILIDCTNFPDSAMTLAIVCSLFNGTTTTLNGLSTLKHKECDRLFALKTELNKVGIKSDITKDSLTIKGISAQDLKAAQVETYNDHRMAMCFAILNYFNSNIQIMNPECVNKTFPQFWYKYNLTQKP